jgi:hypothetical protein
MAFRLSGRLSATPARSQRDSEAVDNLMTQDVQSWSFHRPRLTTLAVKPKRRVDDRGALYPD